MDEQNENEKKKDDNEGEGFDPTKVAFFSDMNDMQEEIMAEAYELVKHALSLLETYYFDDAIEIIKQAMGLYEQVDHKLEVDALHAKITEIQLMKEKHFREKELEIEVVKEDISQETEIGEENRKRIEFLLREAEKLIKDHQFDKTLDIYDELTHLYQEMNDFQGLEKLNGMIEECYNKKADYLHQIKSSEPSSEDLIGEKLTIFEETKLDESQISSRALELVGRASELRKGYLFDEALELYQESINLFEEINWVNEAKNIKEIIEDINKQKVIVEETADQARLERKRMEQITQREEERLIEQSKNIEQMQIQERELRLKELSEKRQEEDDFRLEISNNVDHAEKLVREYELEMKKAIKEGSVLPQSIYSEVISIYESIKDMVSQRGWNDQVIIYDRQIKFYTNKLLQDGKLREVEAKKAKKQKSYEESLKFTKKEERIILPIVEDVRSKELEEQESRKLIENLIKSAERMAREYDIAFKKAIKRGNLDIQSKYPEILEIYTQARTLASQKGWTEEASVYSTHIKKYKDLYNKELNIRDIEAKKIEKDKEFEKSHQVRAKDELPELKIQKLKSLEQDRIQQEQELAFREQIDSMVNSAEKMAREYDIAFKKAIKQGNLDIQSKYPEILEIYTQARTLASQKGWTKEAGVYSTQIKKYTDLYDKELNVREIEEIKLQKEKEFEDMYKIHPKNGLSELGLQRVKSLEQDRIQQEQELAFREQIDSMVNLAEKMARDYDIAFKKAIKQGNLDIQSKYPEILEIYTQARTLASQKGWTEEASVYSTQIKKYTDLYDKESNVREIEAKKIEKDKEFEELKRKDKVGTAKDFEFEKYKLSEETQKIQEEDGEFENYIDNIINSTLKDVREYEMAIKRGQFERECPYLKISEIYEDIYKQVYKKGWKDEAELYKKQITIFREKCERDNRLRQLELEKLEKQKVYEESLRVGIDEKEINVQKFQELEGKKSTNDVILEEAMNLINEAENAVRSYELTIKKEVLLLTSPYDDAILKYEQAKKKLKEINWIDESNRLIATINFYKEKKARDDSIRELAMQKLEDEKKESIKMDREIKNVPDLRELSAIAFETSKKEKNSEVEVILNGIQEAEKIAKQYELEIKKGILDVECPYEHIIEIYQKAKRQFEQIGWTEQASQILNSISFYQEKLISDKNLRELEKQKLQKEEEELHKQKLETKLVREAEAELMKQKVQALELKKQKEKEYESKKDQAFSMMDLAKRELKLDNFETAIKYYNESEKIFSEINWKEGIQMVKGSIKAIENKKEKIEYERKLKIRQEQERLQFLEQMDEKISKAEELKRIQEEQKRQEFLITQRQKEQEKTISEEAYALLEIGTELKNQKKFIEAHEKYTMARNLFDKLGWNHEVSRINNELLFILKKERKQHEKLKTLKQVKIEKDQEIEALLKEAEIKRNEQEEIKKEEKKKKREEFVEKEWERANGVIKDLKYNEGVIILKKVAKKLKKMGKDKLLKQVNKQIETLKNASLVPLITIYDVEKGENMEKFEISYRGLDSAQISLSKNQFLRAISELNEVKFNLQQTLIGLSLIPFVDDTINSLKSEVEGKSSISAISTPHEIEESVEQEEEEDLRTQISIRREERKRRIQELLEKEK